MRYLYFSLILYLPSNSCAHLGLFYPEKASSATISVLDPAYPPARQKIYLEVAQPRALVQIARATKEAGPLAPIVRSYIDDELDLKTEVPSLRIGDDGILAGGEDDHGHDLFAQARTLASSQPDAHVGPDSAPTLSFTSGSEGRPKVRIFRRLPAPSYLFLGCKTSLKSHSFEEHDLQPSCTWNWKY